MSDTPEKKREDYGIIGPYETPDGPRWGIRIRLGGRRGRLIRRKGFKTKTAARTQLAKWRHEREEKTVDPAAYRRRKAKGTTIADLLELVIQDYARKGRKHPRDARAMQRFWTEWKGDVAAATVTGQTLLEWADELLARGLKRNTVNNKIGKLLRAYKLAMHSDPPLVTQIPPWTRLNPGPPRSGFFEDEEYYTLRAALKRSAPITVTIGFWTGMRYGEIITLTRPQLSFDHQAKTVRIQLTGLTKNGKPRQVIMGGELYESLVTWCEAIRGSTCPYICQWKGKRVKSIKRAWTSTCIKLGYGTGIYDPERRQWTQYKGKIFHDFRRTGLRNLIRAGVDRDVAMSITGHLTDNVFSRYNIVNEEDLAEAGRKVVKHMAARHMQNTNSSAANGHAVPNHEHANSAASQFGGITWGITPPNTGSEAAHN